MPFKKPYIRKYYNLPVKSIKLPYHYDNFAYPAWRDNIINSSIRGAYNGALRKRLKEHKTIATLSSFLKKHVRPRYYRHRIPTHDWDYFDAIDGYAYTPQSEANQYAATLAVERELERDANDYEGTIQIERRLKALNRHRRIGINKWKRGPHAHLYPNYTSYANDHYYYQYK